MTTTARLFVLGALSTLAISLVWWSGLEPIADHRRLEHTDAPEGVALRASMVVGLSGVLGLACARLLRGLVVRIVTISLTAVALGLVLLLARPVAPWLPVLNVQSFLNGGASYDLPRDQVVCTPSSETRLRLNEDLVGFAPVESCTPDHRTRTSGEAALYLVATTLLLVIAAGLTTTRRRSVTRHL